MFLFITRPEAEPARVVIKLKTFLSKEKQHLSCGEMDYRFNSDWRGEGLQGTVKLISSDLDFYK